jgi:hypothetical protein
VDGPLEIDEALYKDERLGGAQLLQALDLDASRIAG